MTCGAFLGAHSILGEYRQCSPCRHATWEPDPLGDGEVTETGNWKEDRKVTRKQREEVVAQALRADPCECGGPLIEDDDGRRCLMCGRYPALSEAP